jgi:GAF domain-containing protein
LKWTTHQQRKGKILADHSLIENPTNAQLRTQIDALLDPADAPVTLMANLSSLLFWSLPGINWVGFYLIHGDRLLLGPFHGKPACTMIALGSGVCSAAVKGRRTMNVPDVAEFPGHIACDAASRSELVVPLVVAGRMWGVLDVDSPETDRFDRETQQLLEYAAEMFISRIGSGSIFPA